MWRSNTYFKPCQQAEWESEDCEYESPQVDDWLQDERNRAIQQVQYVENEGEDVVDEDADGVADPPEDGEQPGEGDVHCGW